MSKPTVAAIVLLLASPLVVVPGALNRFVFGKLAAAALGCAVAALAPATGRLRRDATITLSAGSVVLGAAALSSAEPVAALLGRAPRYEGVFVLATYLATAWAGARLLGPGRDQRVTILALRILSSVAVLVACFALLEASGLRPLSTDVTRPGSLLGNASDEGALGVLALGVLAVAAMRSRDRLVATGVGAAGVVTVLSASRAAMGAMVVEIVLVGVVIGGRRVIAGMLVALVAAGGLAFAVPATRDRVIGTSPSAGHTVTGRELLWRETLRLDGSHLALGVGPSNYKTAIVAYHDREWQAKVGPQDPPDSPHSLPLQALSVGGVPLLLFFFLLCGLVLVVGGGVVWRSRRTSLPVEAGVVVSLVGYGVVSLVGLSSPGPTLVASVFLGIALSAKQNGRPRRAVSAIVASGMSVLGLVFFLAAVAEIPLRSAILEVSRGDVAGADHDFAVARALRPWDVDLPDIAAHAFITYGIAAGNAAAVTDASTWVRRVPGELRRDEQIELDQASLDEADQEYVLAERLLHEVLTNDRDNPAVLLQLGIVEAEGGSPDLAEGDFRAAAAVVPADPGPWMDLAALYQSEGRDGAAAAALEMARKLSGNP